MMSFLHPRLKIGIVIMLSFLISGFIMKYAQGETEVQAPTIELKQISTDFSQSISDSGSSFLSLIQSIRIPQLISFTPPSVEPTPEQEMPATPTPQEWVTVPSSPPELPTSTPFQAQPTTINTRPSSYPTTKPLNPTAIVQPTAKPTAIPKPTKPPKPTPYPPITTDVRPGTSVQEVAREVGKRACFPYALLMATSVKESGPWLGNLNSTTAKKLNTYGWWKTASKGEICSYLGYSTQSGLIPADSGGGSCGGGVQPDAYDQKIMGLMQVSEEEDTKTRKYTLATLPNSIDRRVLFDNALIYAIATKNRLGVTPPGCDDWPQDIVKLAAEKHFGACAYGAGKNYCTEVWNLYKTFK